MPDWPDWWDYELVLSPHLMKRMTDRDFSETELRAMLDDAASFRPSVMPGRFIITTLHARQPWEVVVEPDDLEQILIVVTAYCVE